MIADLRADVPDDRRRDLARAVFFVGRHVLGSKNPTPEKMMPSSAASESDRRQARQAVRQVLPDRDPLRRLRHRGGLHLPVGDPVPERSAGSGSSTMFGFLAVARRRARLRAGRREPSNGRAEREPSTSTSSRAASQGFATTQARRAPRLGAQVLALQVPVRHRVLRHGVHGRSPARASTSRASAPRPRASRRARAICSGSSARSASARRPSLKRIYEQMMEPKWVLAFGTCASLRRLLRQLHDASPGIDKIIPCDVYVPGLPAAPRGRPRRPHAPAGQDRARRPHARRS